MKLYAFHAEVSSVRLVLARAPRGNGCARVRGVRNGSRRPYFYKRSRIWINRGPGATRPLYTLSAAASTLSDALRRTR
jgi:hypothetical protein